MGWCACNPNKDVQVTIHAVWDVFTVFAEDTTDNELAYSHTDCTVYEEGSATGLVNVEEDDAGEDDEEGVLHARNEEVGVAC